MALADFGLITFTGAVAVANGKLGSISQFPHLRMMMQRSDSTLLAAPSGAVLLLSQYVETTMRSSCSSAERAGSGTS